MVLCNGDLVCGGVYVGFLARAEGCLFTRRDGRFLERAQRECRCLAVFFGPAGKHAACPIVCRGTVFQGRYLTLVWHVRQCLAYRCALSVFGCLFAGRWLHVGVDAWHLFNCVVFHEPRSADRRCGVSPVRHVICDLDCFVHAVASEGGAGRLGTGFVRLAPRPNQVYVSGLPCR